MSSIYTPSGRAREYGKYALNLFNGCTHGCLYCFSPSMMHKTRDDFHASCLPTKNVLTMLKKDLVRFGVLDEAIFLCFLTDPYCIDADTLITRAAIRIILESGNTVNILTKGGLKARRDFDLLSSMSGNKIGATLTFTSVKDSVRWEPNADDPYNRLQMLKDAKAKGIKTWASIEPVIDPIESLLIMEAAIPYVDEFKIGKLNHHPLAKEINWRNFAMKAKEIMEYHNKKYVLKEDLAKYL